MRALWITGLVLMVAPFFVAVVMFSAGGGLEAFVSALVFTFVIGPIMFIVGLILLIMGLAVGGGQQQQQQVVVYTGTRRCPRCSSDIEGSQRFCSACGAGAHG